MEPQSLADTTRTQARQAGGRRLGTRPVVGQRPLTACARRPRSTGHAKGSTIRVGSLILGTRSVLLLDGAEHLRRRKLALPPFYGQSRRA